MKVCNIQFFDKALNLIHHAATNEFTVNDDQLTPSETTITISKTNLLEKGMFVYITEYDFFGILCGEPQVMKYYTSFTIKPFISLFDSHILFDLYSQSNRKSNLSNKAHGESLEEVIFNRIDEYWGSSQSDKFQRIQALNIDFSGETTIWDLKLESEVTQNNRYAIKNLLTDVLKRSLMYKGITVSVVPDFNEKKIYLDISKKTTPEIWIEADRDNVMIGEFKVKDPSSSTNKLVVHNSKDVFGTKISYYLYDDFDHTWGPVADTGDPELPRIYPVVQEIEIVTPDDPGTENEKNFNTLAEESAKNTFDAIEFTDLIELTVPNTDRHINPLQMVYGQKVKILHEGKIYRSILTGREFSGKLTKLIFGMVRTDLTKKILLSK